MRILEQSVIGKHDDALRCEDVVVVNGPLVAVIDGTTDKSGTVIATPEGDVSTGRFAATVLAGALASLPPGTAPEDAVALLTAAMASAFETVCGALGPHERPSASVVVLDASARRVWRVGDCPFRIDDASWTSTKRIDQVASDFRAAFLAASRGESGTEPGTDPGRDAILPLLRIQGNLANVPGEFGYGVLNGTLVPSEFIEVVQLPASAREVVLASDGYPSLSATLAEAESELARLLALDPACVGLLRSTKGLVPGSVSFDDRSWVRVALDA